MKEVASPAPLSNGHGPKRELYDQMWAMLAGIEAAREVKA